MTTEQVKALTDEELRIKVAELLGWRNVKTFINQSDRLAVVGVDPDPTSPFQRTVPDYPNDLNACHEMASVIPDDKLPRYCDLLLELAGENRGGAFESTARQRCEAFVLTMEGAT